MKQEAKTNGIYSLWDAEQKERRGYVRRERDKKIFQLIGLTENFPSRAVGKFLEVRKEINPEGFLRIANYTIQPQRRGYIKRFATDKRYHAYVLGDTQIIQIHTDKVSRRRHIASTHSVDSEIKRLTRLANDLTRDLAEECKPKRKLKNETLPLEEQKKLVAEVREKNAILLKIQNDKAKKPLFRAIKLVKKLSTFLLDL